MAINSTSFTNTPQAGDDNYSWTEDQLVASGLVNAGVVSLNVMGNDLGGKAKTLFSIDDGNGNTLAADFQLLANDVTNGVSPWEATAAGNWVRINNGQIEFKLGGAASGPAPTIDSLSAGQQVNDEFVYAIRLANGTLSQARVTLHITGTNDAAVIGGASTGSVIEAGDVANGTPGTPTASGTLTDIDVDNAANTFQTVAAGTASAHGYGTYAMTAGGAWTYTLDNGNAAVQALNVNDTLTDTFSVQTADGTTQVLTVTVHGTNDAAVLSVGAANLTEANNAAAISTSGTLAITDVDSSATFVAQTDVAGTYGKFSVGANGAWTYSATSAHNEFAAGTTHTDTFAVFSADGTATSVTVKILGTNDAPVAVAGSKAGAEDTTISGTVASNDSDIDDGATLTYSLNAPVAGLAIAADGGYSFDAGHAAYQHLAEGATANVVANYTVTDEHGATSTSTLTITLTGTNDAPVLTGTQTTLVAGTEDAPYTVSAANLLAGFTDVDGDTLSVSGLTANHGTVVSNTNGTFTITPSANFNGPVTLNYSVIDSNGGSVAGTQSYSLTAVNDAPVLTGTQATLVAGTEDTAYTVSAADLLQGFSDVDTATNGQVLSVADLVASNGTVVQNGDGTFTITPSANFNGPVTLSYNVIDGNAGSVAGTQSYSLTAVNDAPTGTATAVLGAGTEDAAYTVSAADLLAGFSDVDIATNSQVLSVSGLSASNGTVVANADGTFTITPSANFNGPVTLNYNVVDGHGGSVAASQSYSLTAVNDAPTGAATAVLGAGTEDTAYTVSAADLLQGFSDVDTATNGQVLSVADLVASNGTVATNADGTFTITPSANFNGAVNLSYNVIDSHGGSVAGSQSYSLTAVNDVPTGAATATLVAGTEDTAYTVSAADLLAGFSDVDIATNGQLLSVADLVASNGTVVQNVNGTFTITPSANFNGPVTLNYNVIDGHGGSVVASQSYSLAAINDAPTGAATATLIAGTEDTAYTVSAADLLQGFSDVDTATNGQVLSVSGLTSSNGTVVANANGTFTITPSANFNGPVTLNYNVIDGNGGSVAGNQSFNLAAVNDAPVLTGTQATLVAGTEDTAYTVSAADLLAGFSDVDIATNGQVLSVAGLAASNGTVVANGDGTYTITPSANFNGPVTLNYNVIDGNGGSVVATQSYSLAAVNDAPVLTGTQATLVAGTEDAPYTVSAANLLAGFTDVDGDTLSVSGLTSNHGTVIDNGNGTFTVTPTANYNGSMGLSYNVIDGHGGSVAASETFNLAAVNDAPVLTGAQATLVAGTEDVPYTVSAANLLAGFTDVDGDTLSVSGLTSNHGTVIDNGNGTFTVTPTANYNGSMGLSYSVIDGHGGSVAASESFNLAAVNDAPTTAPVTLTAIAEDSGVRVITQAQLLGNASDLDGDSLIATNLAIASGMGSLVSNGNGTWNYTPALNDGTSVGFSYTVTDGSLSTAGNATMDITPVNDAPTDIDFNAAPPLSGNALPGAGAMIATLTTDDVDNSTGFTYSFSGGTGSGFALGASTGVLTTNAALASNSTYTLKFVSADAGGLQTPEQTLTIITGKNGGSDSLPGQTGDDILYALDSGTGGGNKDVVFAGAGNDTVFGQNGTDEIHGGDGNDVLYGGAGTDTFFFDTALNAAMNVDTIKDFASGSDKISLSKSGLFTALGAVGGNLTGDFSASSTTASTGAEHVFYDPATGNLYYDANAGSHSDAVLFANLTDVNGTTHPPIAATDFIIG